MTSPERGNNIASNRSNIAIWISVKNYHNIKTLQECQVALYKSHSFYVIIFTLSNCSMFLTQQTENYLILANKVHKWGWDWESWIHESYILAFLDSNLLYFYYSFLAQIFGLWVSQARNCKKAVLHPAFPVVILSLKALVYPTSKPWHLKLRLNCYFKSHFLVLQWKDRTVL